MATILLVDDEKRIREGVSRALKAMGHDVATAADGAEALDTMAEREPDVVITDLFMPGMDGMQLLAAAKERHPRSVVIIFTGRGTIESAVSAIKDGAFDYITKPFNLDAVEVVVNRAVAHRKLLVENASLKDQIGRANSYENIIGGSETMRDVYRVIDRIKDTWTNVLVTGESGSGKELVARAVHFSGAFKHKPFVTVDCASLSENLLESELFGHVKGAFTSAHRDKTGYFETADGGTVFLDEIAEFSSHLQTRLLRVIQEGEFSRVGETASRRVKVRIIAATNRNLEQAVRSGAFREDLFYRLNVISINVPPLRKRIEDIPDLVEFFLSKFNKKFGKNISSVSSDALAVFAEYDWPGNVRELENLMERTFIFCDDDVMRVHHLQEPLKTIAGLAKTEAVPDLTDLNYKDAKEAVIRRFGREYFEELLEKCEGNISEAARRSGIDRGCFYRLIKKFNVDKPEYTQE
ncbi:MAG: Nitrogen assimilation regulatory protein [bacterium ADurb.Bin236]|nr:MAG: Nitrogen assimilation regulatory protein [bacterium ADurb.Bin236]HOY64672.1 sigma-54 dependent transcriptional regulator [bacterium]